MPIVFAVLIGTAIALILVQTGTITTARLVASIYGAVGAVLGIVILRFLVGPLGLAGGVIGAIIGAVILLYLARRFSGSPGE